MDSISEFVELKIRLITFIYNNKKFSLIKMPLSEHHFFFDKHCSKLYKCKLEPLLIAKSRWNNEENDEYTLYFHILQSMQIKKKVQTDLL